MLMCPIQCLSKVVVFLYFFLFLNAALCKLNYLQVIRIFSKVFLTYLFNSLFCIFFLFLIMKHWPHYICHVIDVI